MKTSTVLAFAASFTSALALSGQATTTVRLPSQLSSTDHCLPPQRYYDGQEGACGCGTSSSSPFQWQTGGSGFYTAAASQAIFDSAGSTWCGSGCGLCFQLTSTGSAPSGQGTGGASGQSITVMVTNLCPNAGNAQWCPNPGSTNNYGFEYHFDLMASNSGLSEVLGDNPIVNFSQVSCPSAASTDYSQCQCAA